MIRLGCGLISGFVHWGHFNPSPSHDDIRTQDPYLTSGLHVAAELPGFFLCRHRPFRHQFTISPMQFPPT